RTKLSQESESLQKIESSLKENFKLSSYEARAYLALLRRGKQSPKQISSVAQVPMPRVYDTLESLMSKGFVAKQEENYSPIPPKQALKGRTIQFEAQFSQEQKRRRQAEEDVTSLLEGSVSPLEKSESSGEISILKGFNAISNKFTELLENSHDVILVAKRSIEAKEVFIPILAEYASQKNGKKRIRIIAPKGVKITPKEAAEARNANAEIRKSDHVIFDLMIADTDDVIIGVPDPLSEEINHAIAIWVSNPSFASSTRNAVEEIWKSADKV
ncbi:MAG TPA: helix-turn-helix domain-containing protein, partial [Nitrososphaerales archaeon]|nr:helix-turn-helix domain-containing protein [Nitrososphaerales archaeon]